MVIIEINETTNQTWFMQRLLSNKQKIHIILSKYVSYKTDQKLHHEEYLIKFQKADIMQVPLADYNLIKLESENNMRANRHPWPSHPLTVHDHSS